MSANLPTSLSNHKSQINMLLRALPWNNILCGYWLKKENQYTAASGKAKQWGNNWQDSAPSFPTYKDNVLFYGGDSV